jgi:CPA1 family monovalent cation:H+ antiporter
MGHLSTDQIMGLLTALLMAAATVGIAVKWVRLPYTIALVIVGLVIGELHLLPPIQLTPELLLPVCLPALLFEASWNLPLAELWRNVKPIFCMSTFGVVFSGFLCAVLLHQFTGLDFRCALVFGALISATDPISVLSLFRQFGADRRLCFLLEGESLFNDGIAVVFFRTAVLYALAQAPLSLDQVSWLVLKNVLGGILIGCAVGYAGSRVIKVFEDRLLEITLTVIVAYGSFLIAERFGLSAVLAVLTASMVFGNYAGFTSMSPSTRLAVDAFWEYAAFLVNSLVFILVGMQVHLSSLGKELNLILVGIGAVLCARLITVLVLAPATSSPELPIPLQWQVMLFWGGLRGALSMALVLSLPATFPLKDKLIVLTFSVTLFTLLVPGLTVELLAKVLGLLGQAGPPDALRLIQTKLVAEDETLKALDAMLKRGSVTVETHNQMADTIELRKRHLQERLDDMQSEAPSIEAKRLRRAKRHLQRVRKHFLLKLARNERLEPELVREAMLGLDDDSP